MENKYYEINEKLAEQAKAMYSFFDYIKGSQTKSYQNAVDYAYSLVTNLPETLHEKAYYYADMYAKKYAENINARNRNQLKCPSVMIAGGSNFPVHKKEKQNARYDTLMRELIYIDKYLEKIKDLTINKTIYSNDEFAIEKLQNKLKDLEENQEEMKQANAYFKKNKTMKEFKDITDEEAEKIDIFINKSYEKKPYETYQLQNNNANIKNTKERIEKLLKLKASTNEYEKIDGIEIKENKELMRIQLIFNGKPSEEIRDLLKSKGFHWSPKESAWQRQLTDNAIKTTKKIIEILKQ